MARKLTGGLVGQPSVGAINVAPTAVITAAENQNITLSPEGTASVVVTNDLILNDQKDLRFGDADSSNYVAVQAPTTVATNYTLTLPETVAGTNGFALVSNTSGVLSWAQANAVLSDNTVDSSTNYIAFTTETSGNLTSARISSTKLTFQPSTGTVDVSGLVKSLRTENIQTGSYTLQLTDRNQVVTMNNGGSATVTIPLDSTVNFPIGSTMGITRIGSGSLTLAAEGGVTVNAGGTGNLALGETVELRKRAANSWIVFQRPHSVTGTGGASTTTIGDVTVHQYTANGASTFVVGT